MRGGQTPPVRCHDQISQNSSISQCQIIALTCKWVDAVCRITRKHKARRRDPASPCRLQRPCKPVSSQRHIAQT